jgi:DNA ligase (NAD+)
LALEKSKDRPLSRIIYALGLRHVGESTSKTIASYFKSWEAMMNMHSFEAFMDVPDVGPIVADSLYQFFGSDLSREIYDILLRKGFSLKEEVMYTPSSPLGHEELPLKNTQVVLTGSLSIPRQSVKNILEMLGAKVTGSISNKTDIVLSGDHSGSKLEQAKKMGIDIWNEEHIKNICQKFSIEWK